MDAEKWHIPLSDDHLTVREALKTMESFKLDQQDVPFIIRLFENPKYNLLPGAVSLQAHDIIHILLGRGVLPKDEAFVIGFTMGTSTRLSKIKKCIFKFITRYLYPKEYKFGHDEHRIYDAGIQCAKKMFCTDFSKLDMADYIDYTIKDARKELEIDMDTLLEEYKTEKAMFDSPESQRLL